MSWNGETDHEYTPLDRFRIEMKIDTVGDIHQFERYVCALRERGGFKNQPRDFFLVFSLFFCLLITNFNYYLSSSLWRIKLIFLFLHFLRFCEIIFWLIYHIWWTRNQFLLHSITLLSLISSLKDIYLNLFKISGPKILIFCYNLNHGMILNILR